MPTTTRRPTRRRTLAVLVTPLLLIGAVVVAQSPAVAVDPPPPTTRISSWGSNSSGQLGNAASESRAAPATTLNGAIGTKAITTVVTGRTHSCALAGGAPYCWGLSNSGQLGTGVDSDANTPAAVLQNAALAGKTITSISTSGWHTCVVADAAPVCWGKNDEGLLGNNTTTYTNVPVETITSGAIGGRPVTAVSAGGHHTCAIADGKPYCWGDNSSGALGNGTTTNSNVPVAVTTSGALSGKTVTAISAGFYRTCAIADGRSYCWGDNNDGGIGNGSFTSTTVPVATTATGVLSGKTVTAVATGLSHTCVVASGAPYCWGQNDDGNLGNASTTAASIPVATDTTAFGGKAVTAISTTFFHTCAVAGGASYCWGPDGNGRIGNGAPTADAIVPTATAVTGSISGRVVITVGAGGDHSAALSMIDPAFCDVTSAATFFSDIVWLSSVGITTGSGGCFNPNGTISRQAMAAFLYRALNPGVADRVCVGSVRRFVDVSADNSFCGVIEWLASSGITIGNADGTFNPYGTVSRQAMAAFLFRATSPGRDDPTCTGSTRRFTDVSAANGFCGAIEWLATSGITTGYPDGTFNYSGTVSRQAMAAFIHRALT